MPEISTVKIKKEVTNKNRTHRKEQQKKPRFGICFDVDGVLARGTIPIPAAQKAFKYLLQDEKGDVQAPIVFVTNSLNRNQDKANQISSWFNIPISPRQIIGAQGPLEVFKQYHNKHCLILGQGKIREITSDLGFNNICTMEQVAEAYPLLDMVDHDNRKRIAREGYTEKELPRIEAIIMLGEPKRWESSLQLLIDLLKTDGLPTRPPTCVPEQHMPIIACNMDLQFMDRACMPRYGHGAFLVCLEALYKKCTGNELKYTALIGKPSEITYRFAEHCVTREARKLGIDEDIERIYLVGDTPDADIVGSNLYDRYIKRLHARTGNQINGNMQAQETTNKDPDHDPELPHSRNMPPGTKFHKQTVNDFMGLLVCTGVYKPGMEHDEEGDEKHYHGHRDFPKITELYKPHKTFDDVYGAIEYILQEEQISFH